MNFPGSTVACPTCGAVPPDPCMNQNGRPRVRFHPDRPAYRQEPPSSLMNQIIHGDALTQMKKLPDGCVNLVATSPPYNRRKSTGGGMKGKTGKWPSNPISEGYGDHGDDLNVADYIEWQRKCVWEMCRLLAPGGAIFYVHRGRVQDGEWEDHGATILRKLPRGFQLRQRAIWDQGGGVNMNPGYYPNDHEYIFIVARRGEWKHPETMQWPAVWRLGSDSEKRGVPSFPLELPRRAIQSTPTAQLVFDPFLGSGTTAVAAVLEGRAYLGIELNGEMVQSARARIGEAHSEIHPATHSAISQVDSGHPETHPAIHSEAHPAIPQSGQSHSEVHPAIHSETHSAISQVDSGHPETHPAIHSEAHPAIPQSGQSHSEVHPAIHSETHSAIPQPDLSAEAATVQLAYGHIRLQVLQNGGFPLVLTSNGIAAAIGKSPRSVDSARTRLRQIGAIVCDDEGRQMLYSLPGGHQRPKPLTAAIRPEPSSSRNKLRNELRDEPARAPAGRPGIDINPESLEDSEDLYIRAGRHPAIPQLGQPHPATHSAIPQPEQPACPECGPVPLRLSGKLAARGVDGVLHCAGQDGTCSYLYDTVTGLEVMPPGLPEMDIDEAAAFIRRSREWNAGKGRAAVSEAPVGGLDSCPSGNDAESDPWAEYVADEREWNRGE